MAACTLLTRGCDLFIGAMEVAACAMLFVSGSARAQSATASDLPSTAEELSAVKAESVRLRGLIPSQSHAMMDVSYHFTNLWFAGQHSNWPLAQFYLNEVRNHIKWSIRLVPVRKTKNGPVKLADKFEPFDNAKLAEIQKQIAAKDRKQFSAAYRDAMTGCNDCHAASDKPYLLVTVPRRATAEGIDFASQKGQ
jgi:hypothetical protein